MPRAETLVEAEVHRQKLEALVKNFASELKSPDLRRKVQALAKVFAVVRALGSSLLPPELASAARSRILYYLQKYVGVVIAGEELLVVSGIQDYPRRIRELRVQFGWAIASGVTMKEMQDEEEVDPNYQGMKTSDYVLLSIEQDREAALRWNQANAIRKQKGSIHDKLLEYLKLNLGKPVTNEELRYVANQKSEWARRVRELRTEHGWSIATKTTGRPDLKVGMYVLESERQLPAHDRKIPDDVRGQVLRRDDYRCTSCAWNHEIWNPSDPRHLELHHIEHHASGGKNIESNLTTLCNICHDKLHREAKKA